MGWIKQIPADPHRSGFGCEKPDSDDGQLFAPHSLWQCDECGRRWLFEGTADDGRNGSYDRWELLPVEQERGND
jgi:hypothetical protein